ncbi:MAG: hypothetical protein LBQ51_08910 [Desulfovibrio sp.]|jgi:hypothetical protein|nr:hypothetical protein [Desulfovibrio sp.]
MSAAISTVNAGSPVGAAAASDHIDDKNLQENLNQCDKFLQEAIRLQKETEIHSLTVIPDDMVKYMKKNMLTLGEPHWGGSSWFDKENWNITINSLKAHRDLLLDQADNISIANTKSPQYKFALIQCILARKARKGAEGYMDKLEKSKEEQKEVSRFLQEAQSIQGMISGSGYKAMPLKMVEYMKKNKLDYSGGTIGDGFWNNYTKSQWDVPINSLKAHQDQLTTSLQQDTLFAKEMLGQYSSFQQGAASAVQDNNRVQLELARMIR